eukprot:1160325-Pelagomonas_calceolata.AAC.14
MGLGQKLWCLGAGGCGPASFSRLARNRLANGLAASATQPTVPSPHNTSTLHTAHPYSTQPESSAGPPFSAYAGYPSQPQGATSSQPLAYSGVCVCVCVCVCVRPSGQNKLENSNLQLCKKLRRGVFHGAGLISSSNAHSWIRIRRGNR